MIIAPAKPINTAIQRRSRTFSPRNSAAPIVTKIGPVKPKAVTLAKVVSGKPMNHRNIPPAWMAPRNTCSGRRSVRMARCRPSFRTIGISISVPKK